MAQAALKEQPPQPIDIRFAQMEAERNSLVHALSSYHSTAPADVPLDIEKMFGRVKQLNRELAAADPYKLGYDSEWQRLQEVTPRTREHLEALAEAAERHSGPRAHIAAMHTGPHTGSAGDYEWRYHQGEQKAIEHWVFEHQPRLTVADELTRYAERQERRVPVIAEAEIARNFAAQLTAGNTVIDLSQQYMTDDPEKAQKRHDVAVGNIAELIEEARNHGYVVNTGNAVAVKMREAEVYAISEGMRL